VEDVLPDETNGEQNKKGPSEDRERSRNFAVAN
jgi:hypothetical protein